MNSFDDRTRSKKELSKTAFLKFCRRCAKRGRDRAIFIFGIFERKTGSHLGRVDLWVLNPVIRTANLGYYVHNPFWGHGYASEAARLAQKIAFGPLNLRRVEASCELKNKASACVALKSGMIPEGLRRKYPIPSGMKDLFVYGMNSVDFRRRR
jgi:ribosomal-protein-alanine N-acetyltransferase